MSGTVTITLDERGAITMRREGIDAPLALYLLEKAKAALLADAPAPPAPGIVPAALVPRLNGGR